MHYHVIFHFWLHFIFPGGENDDHRSGDLCHLLAAIPYIFPCYGVEQAAGSMEVHSADLFVRHVACHELHHVQPHYLLLPEQQVRLYLEHATEIYDTNAFCHSNMSVVPSVHCMNKPYHAVMDTLEMFLFLGYITHKSMIEIKVLLIIG